MEFGPGLLDRLDSNHILRTVEVPNIQLDDNDKVMWLSNMNKKMSFSTEQTWMDLRTNWPNVVWKNVVWYSRFIPKHAFILWLAVQGKLMTQDRIARWQSKGGIQCALCKISADSHEHLSFQCEYARGVWNELEPLKYRLGIVYDLQDLVSSIAILEKCEKYRIGG
uniref:uncharacterized protein LOC122587517 n=1 Tax=Erigeron canadensis TaxID=72917 RepID=UPI001CB9C0CF|nr:uncharacterized protein LOC122587517 [Erigeron canadensis]